jgi:hypothetical protein
VLLLWLRGVAPCSSFFKRETEMKKVKIVELTYEEKNDLSKRLYPITTHILLTAAVRQVTDTMIRKELVEILNISEGLLSTYEKVHISNPRRLRITPTNRTALNRYFTQHLQRNVDIAPSLELFSNA